MKLLSLAPMDVNFPNLQVQLGTAEEDLYSYFECIPFDCQHANPVDMKHTVIVSDQMLHLPSILELRKHFLSYCSNYTL